MAQTLFVISPLTQEIIPYQYQPDDTFAPILADLEAFDKPRNLMYYNGHLSINLSPHHSIKKFFPPRQSQVVIYALNNPNFPFPRLITPIGYLLIILISESLKELIPLYLLHTDTVGMIVNYLRTNHNLIISLSTQRGSVSQDLLDESETIAEILPRRTEQILLLWRDQTAVVKQLSQFENLPDELIINILLQLPIASIAVVCLASTELARFCRDEQLWQGLVQRDFMTTTKPIDLTWRRRYQQILKASSNELLLLAAESNDLELAQYAIKRGARYYDQALVKAAMIGSERIAQLMLDHGATYYHKAMAEAALTGQEKLVQLMLDYGADNYQVALLNAATAGNQKIIRIILDKMQQQLVKPNYGAVMSSAAKTDQKDIVQMMLNLGATNYEETMIAAAEGGYMDIVQMMLKLGANNYDETMIVAATNGHLEIVKLMLNLMQRSKLAPSYNRALVGAASAGSSEIVELMLQQGATKFEDIFFQRNIIEKRYPQIIRLIAKYIPLEQPKAKALAKAQRKAKIRALLSGGNII